MKQILYLFLLVFLSSCIDSTDEDNQGGLSKSDINKCFTQTCGDYNGYMVYVAQNPNVSTDQADTLSIDWKITTDTMLVVDAFPGKVIAESITRNKELKAAMIEQNPVQKFSSYMSFYGLDPTIRFILGPQKMDFPVYYNGSTHTVTAYFWSNTISEIISYGVKDPSNNEMIVRIVLGAAYLDNREDDNLLGMSNTYMIPIYLTTSF